MINVYQLLRQKELDLERLRREVSALRAVVPLLAEGQDSVNRPELSSAGNKWPLKVDDMPSAPVAS